MTITLSQQKFLIEHCKRQIQTITDIISRARAIKPSEEKLLRNYQQRLEEYKEILKIISINNPRCNINDINSSLIIINAQMFSLNTELDYAGSKDILKLLEDKLIAKQKELPDFSSARVTTAWGEARQTPAFPSPLEHNPLMPPSPPRTGRPIDRQNVVQQIPRQAQSQPPVPSVRPVTAPIPKSQGQGNRSTDFIPQRTGRPIDRQNVQQIPRQAQSQPPVPSVRPVTAPTPQGNRSTTGGSHFVPTVARTTQSQPPAQIYTLSGYLESTMVTRENKLKAIIASLEELKKYHESTNHVHGDLDLSNIQYDPTQNNARLINFKLSQEIDRLSGYSKVSDVFNGRRFSNSTYYAPECYPLRDNTPGFMTEASDIYTIAHEILNYNNKLLKKDQAERLLSDDLVMQLKKRILNPLLRSSSRMKIDDLLALFNQELISQYTSTTALARRNAWGPVPQPIVSKIDESVVGRLEQATQGHKWLSSTNRPVPMRTRTKSLPPKVRTREIQSETQTVLSEDQITFAKSYFDMPANRNKTKLSRKQSDVWSSDFSVIKVITDENAIPPSYELYSLYHGKGLSLGSGSNGTVKLCCGISDSNRGKWAAIKIAELDLTREGIYREKEKNIITENEALKTSGDLIGQQIRRGHPDVAKVYTVMEYVPGVPLKDYLLDDTVTPLDKINALISAVRALQELHGKGLIHGDLHFDNIMYDPNNGNARVIDLGFSAKMDSTGRGVAPVVLSSMNPSQKQNFHYAPECYPVVNRLRRRGYMTPASDVYSMAWKIDELSRLGLPLLSKELMRLIKHDILQRANPAERMSAENLLKNLLIERDNLLHLQQQRKLGY